MKKLILLFLVLVVVQLVSAANYDVVLNETDLPIQKEYVYGLVSENSSKVNISSDSDWFDFPANILFLNSTNANLNITLKVPIISSGNYSRYIYYTSNHTNVTNNISFDIEVLKYTENEFIFSGNSLNFTLFRDLDGGNLFVDKGDYFFREQNLSINATTARTLIFSCANFITCQDELDVSIGNNIFWVNISIPKSTTIGNYYESVILDAEDLDQPYKYNFRFNITEVVPEKDNINVNMSDCMYFDDGELKFKLSEACLNLVGYNFSNLNIDNETRIIYEDKIVPVFKYDYNDSISMYGTVKLMERYINDEIEDYEDEIDRLKIDLTECSTNKDVCLTNLSKSNNEEYYRLKYNNFCYEKIDLEVEKVINDKGLVNKWWARFGWLVIICMILFGFKILFADNMFW